MVCGIHFGTDMMIETTLMKTGKSPGGLKGVTLKPELVKKWAFSLNTFGKIDREIVEYFENDCEVLSPNTHNEEKKISIQYATEDREKNWAILKHLVNPLDKEQLSHHQELVNIYTGQFADKSCNLDEAIKIGVEQYKKFISSLPDGFYSTINHCQTYDTENQEK